MLKIDRIKGGRILTWILYYADSDHGSTRAEHSNPIERAGRVWPWPNRLGCNMTSGNMPKVKPVTSSFLERLRCHPSLDDQLKSSS